MAGAASLLHVRDSGRGTPLVLLHPVGTSGALWTDIAPLLAGRYRVLALDLPGHGKSPAPDRPLGIAGMAARVRETLVAYDAVPAHVVGLSIGGMVAQELCIQAPETVRSLVLCGTSCEVSDAASAALEQRARTVEAQGVAAILDETIDRWFSAAFQAAAPQIVARIRAMLLANDREMHAETWRAIKGFRSAGRVAVQRPTLAVYGELEAKAAPATGPALARVFDAGLVVLPGAAHISPLEDVTAFAHLVDDFLKRL